MRRSMCAALHHPEERTSIHAARVCSRPVPVSGIATLLLVVTVSLCSAAQEMRFFGLKHAGQASMSIDRKAHVAYIVDLGDRKDGDSLKFEGSDISDHLAKHGIRDLAIICSHPHEDHMGGIRRFISTRSNFYTSHNKPRFRQVILIDNVPPQLEGTDTITPLWDIFKNTLGTSVSDPRYSHKSAASYNPLYKMSTIKNDVLVMTIPYESKDSQAVHDHSVVTLTILHDKNSGRINSVLDPDDASRDVTDKASTQLLSHGIHIDTLIVPHHGSSSNMDDALLTRLHPTWAIFTVNDDNKYGHPYDEVVIRYTAKLGSENVFLLVRMLLLILIPKGWFILSMLQRTVQPGKNLWGMRLNLLMGTR